MNTVQYTNFYRVFDVYCALVPSLTSITMLMSHNISRVTQHIQGQIVSSW